MNMEASTSSSSFSAKKKIHAERGGREARSGAHQEEYPSQGNDSGRSVFTSTSPPPKEKKIDKRNRSSRSGSPTTLYDQLSHELRNPSVSWGPPGPGGPQPSEGSMSGEEVSTALEVRRWRDLMERLFAKLQKDRNKVKVPPAEIKLLEEQWLKIKRHLEVALPELETRELTRGAVESSHAGKLSEKESEQQDVALVTGLLSNLTDSMTTFAEETETQSAMLKRIMSKYNSFDKILAEASQALEDLKRKTASDATLVWYAFFFFCGTCLYIVLRRLKILWMIYMWCYYVLQPLLNFFWWLCVEQPLAFVGVGVPVALGGVGGGGEVNGGVPENIAATSIIGRGGPGGGPAWPPPAQEL